MLKPKHDVEWEDALEYNFLDFGMPHYIKGHSQCGICQNKVPFLGRRKNANCYWITRKCKVCRRKTGHRYDVEQVESYQSSKRNNGIGD